MSSGHLIETCHPELFHWHAGLDAAHYSFATYHVVVQCDAGAAAVAMAMEQSASTVAIAGYVSPEPLAEWTIRVVEVRPCVMAPSSAVRPYALQTAVYPSATAQAGWAIELAIPKRLLGGSYVQLLNVAIGELPRLGFVTQFRLTSIRGLEQFGPGPCWGIAGIRQRLGVAQGPILCRSMRPAVGLDTATMARLNHDVLTGGFHCVKDDELMFFASNDQFATHVRAMIAARDAARANTGEHKAYLATLICDPEDLEWRWRVCVAEGVDGVLIAPFIQGLGVMAQLARRRELPILAHNTCGELLSRNPDWGVEEAVWNELLRRAGADWLVTSGGYGNSFPPVEEEQQAVEAMRRPLEDLAPTMPIFQGGKRPDELETYSACCRSLDFMLIVASWVDAYPAGLAAGAREFRAVAEVAVLPGLTELP